MSRKKFYITTPIYYTNAKPHIGHAYTTVAADILARWNNLNGSKVFFLTGTDEHGLKIQKVAEKAGKNPQQFVDEISGEFKALWKKLNINYDNFIRTTDAAHKKAVQKVLQILKDKGAIYPGTYEGLYCVGCEQFKTENELVDGKCPEHNAIPEHVKEECYLLKMSDLQLGLVKKIESDEFHIAPDRYRTEILSFLKNQKLKDISISRKNVSWGIPLPFDSAHTTYVWVDAFLNYLTGLGWAGDPKKLPKQWPPEVQLIGKDILRVHATIWPIILMHLSTPPHLSISLPQKLFTHGHILSGGKKMSKTLGNTIAPEEMIEKFGVDATRYLLMSAGTFGDDVDLTMERAAEKYEADLVNGLGNLVARTLTVAEKYFESKVPNISKPKAGRVYTFKNSTFSENKGDFESCWSFINEDIDKTQIDRALGLIIGFSAKRTNSKDLESKANLHTIPSRKDELQVNNNYKDLESKANISVEVNYKKGIVPTLNKFINDAEPWKLIKTNKEQTALVVYDLLESLRQIAWMIRPFMPDTSDKIFTQLFADEKERAAELKKTFKKAQEWGGLKSGTKIKKSGVLFPRLVKQV